MELEERSTVENVGLQAANGVLLVSEIQLSSLVIFNLLVYKTRIIIIMTIIMNQPSVQFAIIIAKGGHYSQEHAFLPVCDDLNFGILIST